MQLSQTSLFAIAAFLSSISAENLLVAVNSDIAANLADYLSYKQEHSTLDYAPLLSLYEEGQTYTDDSYTTLVDSAEMASLSAFATALPWYSSRILPELDASVSSTPVSSTSVSSAAKSSAAPTSSTAHSSITESSAGDSSSATGSSSGQSSQAASSETSASSESSVSTAGAAAVLGQGSLAVAIGLGALALL